MKKTKILPFLIKPKYYQYYQYIILIYDNLTMLL